MKRILVFSDTHGDIRLCEDVIKRIPADMILHAGDYVSDARELRKIFPDKNIIYVQGNGDFFTNAPAAEIAQPDGVRIFLVHGHNHRVKYEHDYHTLARAAKEKDCDIAVFGHTHMEYDGTSENGVLMLNPGSARYGCTYGVIEIENGEPSICVIKEPRY